MKAPVVLLAISVLTYASFAFQSGTVPVESGGSKVSNGSGKATAAKGISTDGASGSKANFSAYHAGPWEQEIGYSQAVRAGHTIYISGTIGANDKGFPKDLESQMKLAYAALGKTMSQYGADFSNVVMERIYTTDMDALIKTQPVRKSIYGAWLPAATWVEVRRLYVPEAEIEIEVELVVD